MRSLRLVVLITLFHLSLITFSSAALPDATETIIIETYYPAPYGVYDELSTNTIILNPQADKGTPCTKEGAMYYNEGDNKVYVCKGDIDGWKEIGGGGGGVIPDGTVMFFNLSSCPDGWGTLADARGRYIVGLPLGGTLLGRRGKALSDMEDRLTGEHGHTASMSYFGSGSNGPVSTDNPINAGVVPLGGGTGDKTAAPYVQLLACQKGGVDTSLVNNQNIGADCTQAGGVVVSAGGVSLCKFSSSSCPSGWSQYQQWTATYNINTSVAGPCFPGDCNLSGHAFSNTAIESCNYGCVNCSPPCPGGQSCGSSACCCEKIATAAVYEVGCY